jgi:hypothetical protein
MPVLKNCFFEEFKRPYKDASAVNEAFFTQNGEFHLVIAAIRHTIFVFTAGSPEAWHKFL